jgi:hypothetical protein
MDAVRPRAQPPGRRTRKTETAPSAKIMTIVA